MSGFLFHDTRKFLERKVEGPPALRLWPGLYFDSDAEGEDSAKEGKRLEGEGLNVRIQVQIRVSGAR